MNIDNSKKWLWLLSLPLVATLPVATVQAADEAESLMEEIVVTARKRDESLQDVPVAVSALSGSQLERGSVQTVIDIAKLVPNVELHTVTQSGAALGASIRGMAFDDLEKSYEPTVGISIDGVFMASNSGAVVDFFDVEAVEVLRGPQGTLYGRNTIAGVINIRRTEPTGEFGLKLEATGGSEDRTDLKGILNTPLGENGGMKLSFRNLNQDSHLYNTFNNERPEARDSEVWSAAFRFEVTDQLTVSLAYDDYDHQTQPPDVIATGTSTSVFCSLAALGLPFGGACDENSGALSEANGYTTSNASEQIYSYIWGNNLTAKAEYESDNYTVKYIFGEMDFSEEAYFNSWGAPHPLYEVLREQDYKQTSHEIQVVSQLDGPFNFVAGLYFLKTDSYLTSGPRSNFTSIQDAEAQAIFGEVTYDISDDWSLTVGGRYTQEDKKLDTRRFVTVEDRQANINESSSLKPKYDDSNFTYRLILQREIGIGMAYASYSTGYRSGGFNSRGNNLPTIGPYASEEVASMELGLRATLNDRLQLNATLFSANYENKQQFVVTDGTQCDLPATSTCTFIRNIAETTNQGLEIEAIWVPTDAITVRATYGYLDAEFDSYNFNGVDISSQAQVIYAPENTASLVIEHQSEMLGGSMTLSGAFSMKSDIWGATEYSSYDYATGAEINIDSHNQFDLSATYYRDMTQGTLKVVLYGTDVFEEDGRVARAYDAGAFAWKELVPGRQLGVTLGYEF